MDRVNIFNNVRTILAVFVAFEVCMMKINTAEYKEMSYADFQRILSYIEEDITRKQVLFGRKVIHPKERLALTIRFLATGETMLKERGKRLQLRFNIPNIPENKRNVEWMLKQSLKAFKLFQLRFDNVSTLFNTFQHG